MMGRWQLQSSLLCRERAGKAILHITACLEKRRGIFKPNGALIFSPCTDTSGTSSRAGFASSCCRAPAFPALRLFLHIPSGAAGRVRLKRAKAAFPSLLNQLSKDLDNRSITLLGSGETVLGTRFVVLPTWVHAADEIKVEPELHVGGLPNRHSRCTS